MANTMCDHLCKYIQWLPLSLTFARDLRTSNMCDCRPTMEWNCSAYSNEPMTPHALAGSRWMLLHMPQREAGWHHGRHLESIYNVISVFRQSMRIYWKNIPALLHPDPIWNDGALGGSFEEIRANDNEKKKKNKMSSDMGSVRDPKIIAASWDLHIHHG